MTPPSATRSARRIDPQVHSPSAARSSLCRWRRRPAGATSTSAPSTRCASARRRRRPEGRQRPPRHGHVAGARGLPALPERHDPRPARPRLAGSRPVRAVLRALQPDAVHPALPLRLRARARRPRGAAHVGQPHAGPPRGAPHHGRRDHHRPARLGPRVRRRHGIGQRRQRGAVRPRRQARRERPSTTTSTCSPPTATSWRASRHEASALAAPPGARQPHAHLRPEPHLDRGRHQHLVLRGRREALRGLRLGRPHRRLAPEHRRRRGRLPLRRGRRRAARRDRGRQEGRATSRPSSSSRRSSRGPRRPSRTPASRTARPSATTRSTPPRSCSASRRSASPSSAPSSRTPARSSSAARPPTRRGTSAYAAWRKANADKAALLDRLVAGELPAGLGKALPTFPADAQGHRRPAPPPARCSTRSPTSCPSCGAARPTSPSPTTRRWPAQPSFIPAGKQTDEWKGGPVRPHPALRHPRVRHGLHPQRDRPRGPHPALRRHLPRLLRLHARRRPARRDHAGSR